MKLLLDDRFAPLTSTIGFLEGAVDTMAERHLAQLTAFPRVEFADLFQALGPGVEIYAGAEVDLAELRQPPTPEPEVHPVLQPLQEPFPEVLSHLERLTEGQSKRLFLETDSHWTAYFDNNIDGAQPEGTVTDLCDELGCRGLIVTCVSDIPWSGLEEEGIGRCAGVQFWLFEPSPEPIRSHHYQRTIDLTADGERWAFEAHGPVQPFEKPERYQARRVRDRFSTELLEEYCAALGIRYFDPSFYGPRGFLVTLGDPSPHDLVLTLPEAQRRIGILR